MGKKLKVTHHLDRDPNDPRLKAQAKTGFSLNDVPEAEVKAVGVEVTETTRTTTPDENNSPVWAREEDVVDVVRLGVDPNDSRLTAGAKAGWSLNDDDPEK